MGSLKKSFVNRYLEKMNSINNKMVEISWGGGNLLIENNNRNIKTNTYVIEA